MRVDGESGSETRVTISAVVVAGGAALVGPATIVTLSAVLASIPPVLDGIVTAAVKPSCNLCPPLTDLVDENLNLGTLFGSDGLVIQGGLQVLVKSFSALLRCPCSQGLSNSHPVQRALVVDKLHEIGVFLLGPRPSPLRSERHLWLWGSLRGSG